MNVRGKGAGFRRWGWVLAAGTAAAQASAPPSGLSARIDAALARLGPHGVRSVRVVSLRSGAALYERNPDLSLNPASNMKLLTSAAALARLGPDYRFTTTVLAAGKVKDGVLDGALVLRGGGDPVLETENLAGPADAVQRSGIREVRGGILADDFRFDAARLGDGWNWDDEPYYYSAQISALTVNRNVLQVELLPGAHAGEPAQVLFKPLADFLTVGERPVTGPAGSPSNWDVVRERARNVVRITGRIAEGAAPQPSKDATVEEPELYAAALFRKLLADRGVKVLGDVRRAVTPPDAAELASTRSAPLSEIAALLNKPSDNLIAEMLLKELGYAGTHSGTAESGVRVVTGFLKEQGIDTGGLSIHDGSGLSRLDLVTTRALTDLLVRADHAPWKAAYFQSLPIAGVDGTLRGRLKGTPAERNLHAKTGSLSHVSGLTGYVRTGGGEPLAFSVLINNYPGAAPGTDSPKRVEDAIAVALAEEK